MKRAFWCVVALWAGLYGERRLLTERSRQIILMLDDDKVGRRATSEIAAQLARCSPRLVEPLASAQADQLADQP
jgi:hypothetical protein